MNNRLKVGNVEFSAQGGKILLNVRVHKGRRLTRVARYPRELGGHLRYFAEKKAVTPQTLLQIARELPGWLQQHAS